MDLIHQIAIGAGLAWASGIRLYAVVFLAGVLGHFNIVHLPDGLHVLMHPIVMSVAGALFLLEFDHAQAAIVEHDQLDRQLMGDCGEQVAEQHGEAAVAAEGDDLPPPVEGLGAEGLRHGVGH